MKKIGIFYGSSTGTTESVAHTIAQKLGVASNDVHDAPKLTGEMVKEYDVLVLGTSTWGCGELQDDWYDAVRYYRECSPYNRTKVGCRLERRTRCSQTDRRNGKGIRRIGIGYIDLGLRRVARRLVRRCEGVEKGWPEFERGRTLRVRGLGVVLRYVL